MNIGMTKAIATQAAKDEIAKVGTGVDNVARTGVQEVKSQLDNNVQQLNNKIDEVANKGTTVDVVKNATKEQVDKYVADGTIANMTIADGTVDIKKTNFCTYERINLFDFSKIINGTIDPISGNISGAQKTSDYIPIDVSKEYKIVGLSLVMPNTFAFYDSNKVRVTAIDSNDWTKFPSNAKYIRFSFYTGAGNVNGMFTLKTTNTTTFIPYNTVITTFVDKTIQDEINRISKINSLNEVKNIQEKVINTNSLKLIEVYELNLFDKTNIGIKQGYCLNIGDNSSVETEEVNANTSISHYIDVVEGKYYAPTYVANHQFCYNFYDKDKNVIAHKKKRCSIFIPFRSEIS